MIGSLINISRAQWDGDYRISLKFDDGTSRTVDFFPFLSRAAHPSLRAYLQPELFQTFRLEYGELVWGDYELCFPTIGLYRGQLDAAPALAEAA
jgi:hypothetical protein